jgi:hypothetical protein
MRQAGIVLADVDAARAHELAAIPRSSRRMPCRHEALNSTGLIAIALCGRGGNNSAHGQDKPLK